MGKPNRLRTFVVWPAFATSVIFFALTAAGRLEPTQDVSVEAISIEDDRFVLTDDTFYGTYAFLLEHASNLLGRSVEFVAQAIEVGRREATLGRTLVYCCQLDATSVSFACSFEPSQTASLQKGKWYRVRAQVSNAHPLSLRLDDVDETPVPPTTVVYPLPIPIRK